MSGLLVLYERVPLWEGPAAYRALVLSRYDLLSRSDARVMFSVVLPEVFFVRKIRAAILAGGYALSRQTLDGFLGHGEGES